MVLGQLMEKARARRELVRQLDERLRIQKLVEQRQKNSNERELERFIEEQRQERIKQELDKFRHQRREELFQGGILNQKNLFQGGNNILKQPNIFQLKTDTFNQSSMFFS